MSLTRFTRSITRYFTKKRLVVRITESGLSFKAHKRHRWHSVTWEQIASLASDEKPIVQAEEHNLGAQALKSMGASE